MPSPHISSINQPGYQYNKDAGNPFESGMTGGAALGTFISTAGGLGASRDVFVRQHVVNADGSHTYEQTYDGRAMTTSALTLLAGAASGAAALSQVAGPGGAVAAAGLGVLANMAMGGFAVQDSRRCAAKLKVIEGKLGKMAYTDPDLVVVSEVVDYCLGQQSTKNAKGWLNASGVGQPVKTLYGVGRGAYKLAKGTKGLARAEHARLIVEIAQKPTGQAPALARELIQALVAKSYDDIMADAVANAMKTG